MTTYGSASSEANETNSYFAELDRIVKPGYSPSGLDILQLRPTANAVTELRTQVGQLSIHIQDAGHQAFGRRRWMKSFKNVTTIIFVVNLDEYDQLSPEDGSTNQMLEYFLLFDDVVNASYFAKTSVIMLFNQPANLKQKLEHSALEDHFPDFIGGPDVLRAAKYILWRFNLLNLAHLAIYPFLVDIYRNEAAHFMGQVLPALQETVLNNAMFGAKGT
jgi:guanine nucleotide-binding protein subunit alpha